MSARSSALRRRRKPSLAIRLKVFWVFIVAGIALASYGGYLLVTLPQLRVGAVDIRIAGRTLTGREVLAAAAVDRHSNVWLLDTAKIERRIEALPYVDRARVRRIPPAELRIAVTEREPAACVRSGAHVVTIDSSRRVLQAGCARPGALQIRLKESLPNAPGSYASGPALAALLADGRILGAAGIAVSAIQHDDFGGVLAVTEAGIRLVLGDDGDLAEKVKLVEPVLAATRAGHVVRALDLRAPATPIVEYR